MADVEVQRVTETKKTRKVKKTKRRESSDQGSEITITEIEQTTTENQDGDVDEEGYVCVFQGHDNPIPLSYFVHSSRELNLNDWLQSSHES